MVELDDAAVEDALDTLEQAMGNMETYLDHDEIRVSAGTAGIQMKDAYETLVRAHPDYVLDTDPGSDTSDGDGGESDE